MEKIKGTNQEKILKQVKKLDNQELTFRHKGGEIQNQKKNLFRETIKDFRITKETDLYFQLRERVLQNDEIKRITEKYGLSFNDIALIEERFDRPEPLIWRGEWSYSDFEKLFKNSTTWATSRNYLYGGPGDKLKIVFRDCHNGRYVLTGFQFKFPEKPKRDWRATFKEEGSLKKGGNYAKEKE